VGRLPEKGSAPPPTRIKFQKVGREGGSASPRPGCTAETRPPDRQGLIGAQASGLETKGDGMRRKRRPMRDKQEVVSLACQAVQEGLARAGGVASSEDIYDLVELPEAVRLFLDVVAYELHVWCMNLHHDPRELDGPGGVLETAV
jgi:hypothetical protein